MSRDEVDHALERLRVEKERIAAGLLELEGQQGYRLLDGASLSGVTERRRDELRGRTASLWKLFEAYGRVFGQAVDLRARHSRPGQEELAELTRLLTGPSVEVPSEKAAPQRPTLLPVEPERLALDAVVARMVPRYEETAKALAVVDAVWSALLDRLGEVEEGARAVRALLDALGTGDSEFDRVEAELDTLRELVRCDPLSLASGDRADTARLDAVGADLAGLRDRLTEAVRTRDEHEERLRRLEESVRLVEEAEREAGQARDKVLVKIASPVLPDLPDLAAALRDRLTALDALRDAGRWTELAVLVAELEGAMVTALDEARAAVHTITGLLERRAELRGRLGAYRAKAARLGRIEDAECARIYRRAHELLWTSPCDLREATAVLAEYQRAIGEASK